MIILFFSLLSVAYLMKSLHLIFLHLDKKYCFSFSIRFLGDEYIYIRNKIKEQKLIVHAGGFLQNELNNFSYTNSKESVMKSIKNGYNFIEIDLQITSDNYIVCTHEWNQIYLNGKPFQGQVTKDEFLQGKSYNNFTSMSLDDLCEFISKNPSLYFITDTKDNLFSSAKIIKRDCPNYYDHFIIQIYHQSEYEPIYQLGFKNIIYTLYLASRKGKKSQTIINFVNKSKIIGITHWFQFNKKFLIDMISAGIPLYIHTVNDLNEMQKYFNSGISAIYTDVNDKIDLKNFSKNV